MLTRSIALGIAWLNLMCFDAANAENACDLNGKSILYTVTMLTQGRLESGRERLTILGDRVLEFDDGASGSQGTVYYLGRRMDISNEPGQQATGADAAVVYYRTFATASYESNLLQTTLEKSIFARRGDFAAGQLTINRTIRVDSCFSCKVLELTISANAVGGASETSRLQSSNSCSITTR